ncbi:MAG: hypothetical protein RJA10_605, partial [Pseudomonadota bacterium]
MHPPSDSQWFDLPSHPGHVPQARLVGGNQIE